MEVVTMAENLTKPAEAVPPLSSQPWLHQHGKEIQAFGTVRQFPLALSYETRMYSCQRLNQILADSQILYALYRSTTG
jgi:starvation-inducible DNA-binding protein